MICYKIYNRCQYLSSLNMPDPLHSINICNGYIDNIGLARVQYIEWFIVNLMPLLIRGAEMDIFYQSIFGMEVKSCDMMYRENSQLYLVVIGFPSIKWLFMVYIIHIGRGSCF